ncbi:uncharacterized protein TM35_000351870 [Trypanosoma theileri]|uniref:Uncharacterized protein n=1 Tax=Trypanosoma theileri TaxID=67003 RepID=A0A1X0NLU5_9TRYP|nr:uncharacterized protein TM35_000351870 [Trypanosoma theileri]ORC85443.1 hypothetical protein TM35_000351870 [Trypanosoma theileri]
MIGPSPSTVPKGTAVRISASPATAADECPPTPALTTATATATSSTAAVEAVEGWRAACQAVCTRSSSLGITRALTAPTPTAVSAKTVITREQQMFPSAPACVQRTSPGRMTTIQSDLTTSGRAESTLNVPQQQIDSSRTIDFSLGGMTSFHAAPQLTSSAITNSLSADENSLRASLSRRGLSVHAAPFQPRSVTELSTLSSTLEIPELGDLTSLRDVQLLQKESTGSIVTSSASVQQPGIRTTTLEFPRTPLARETPRLRLSVTLGACSGVAAVRSPSSSSIGVAGVASACGGESQQRSTPLYPLSPSFPNHQQQRPVPTTGPSVTSNSSGSIVCPPDVKDDTGSDNVRHLRVPFTDAEAMDEAAMLHLLRGSSDSSSGEEDDDDEDVVYMTQQQQQQQVFELATVLPTNFEVYHCAGGYWDLEGPRATTRRFLRRRPSSTASITINAHGAASSTCVPGNGVFTDRAGSAYADDDDDDDYDDDLWEMNSSAYADSLDEAQVEWIEEQLRAKENPEGFFF